MSYKFPYSYVLRDTRLRRKLSQKELAEASGVSQTYISQLERGDGSPTITVFCKLAKALSVNPGLMLNKCEEIFG